MEQSLLSVAVGSNVNTRPQPFFNTKPNMQNLVRRTSWVGRHLVPEFRICGSRGSRAAAAAASRLFPCDEVSSGCQTCVHNIGTLIYNHGRKGAPKPYSNY